MIILWIMMIPLIIAVGALIIISTYKKDSYLKTTKSYIRNVIFFRLKSDVLDNLCLDDESLKQRLSCIIENFLKNDHNLEYKISIDSIEGKRYIKINISNGIKNPFQTINENYAFDLL